MNIRTFSFQHESLSCLSEAEKVALFQLAHLHNELVWSQKNLLWVWHGERDRRLPELDGKVLIFVSTLVRYAGQLHEAWQSIEKVYFGTGISKRYNTMLSADGQAALKQLRRYFSGPNLITDIRNKLAFHSDVELFKSTLQAIPGDMEHKAHFGEAVGNTLFAFAHHVNALNLLSLADTKDVSKALDRLAEEITGKVSSNIFTFLPEILNAMLKQISPAKRASATAAGISDASVRLPFFTENELSNHSPEATPGHRPPAVPSPSSGAPQL